MTIYEFWDEIGYKPCTTYWQDFSIADRFMYKEKNPIQDTYKRALEYAKTDYKVFTELVLVLNHKIWQWYETDNNIGLIYNDLWQKAVDLFYKTFENNEEAISYYYRTTD